MQNQLPQVTGALEVGPLRDLIMFMANSIQEPPDMALHNILGGFGVPICGKYVVVTPSGHEETSSVYSVLIGESGERKSAMAKIAKKPLIDLETKEKSKYKQLFRTIKRERKLAKAKISMLYREAAKSDDPELEQMLLRKIEGLEDRMPEVPTEPRFFFEDTTAPALKRTLARYEGRISHLEPEPGLLNLLRRKDANPSMFCKAYDGEAMDIGRVNTPVMVVPYPAMVISVSSQPGAVMKFIRDEQVDVSGLSARFNYILVRPAAGWRSTYAPPIPQEALDWYRNRIQELYDIPFKFDEFGKPAPYRIQLNDEAAWLYQGFRNRAEPALQPNDLLSFNKKWGSKHPGRVLKLALLLHCIESDDPTVSPISGRSMRQAIAMGDAYAVHAQALYHQAQFGEHIEIAQEIMNWVMAYRIQDFSAEEARKGTVGITLRMIKQGIQYLLAAGAIYEDFPSFADEQSQVRRGRNRSPRFKVVQAGMPPGPQQLTIGQ